MSEDWTEISAIDQNYYLLKPKLITQNKKCKDDISFTQIAFDGKNEHIIAIDGTGHAYYIRLINDCPCYRNIGFVGPSTFVAFNPIVTDEIIVGLITTDIKILKTNFHVDEYYLLMGHKFPAKHVSFYKEFFLTCSQKEVIIWNIESGNKVHELNLSTKNVVKKATLSNIGHIAVLYYNNTIQIWNICQLEKDIKMDLKVHGIRNSKDFVFSQNARIMIVAGIEKRIIILNTSDWTLLKFINLPTNLMGVKQIYIAPLPLDAGANKVIGILSSDCMLHFLNMEDSRLMKMYQSLKSIKKIIISSDGRYVVLIRNDGCLNIVYSQRLFSENDIILKQKVDHMRPRAHKVYDHLRDLRRVKEKELNMKRLLLILKQYGEYPSNHRTLIWSTILKLPSNRKAYLSIANTAINAKINNEILKKYRLASKSKALLLAMIMNYLYHWCPLLNNATFLPHFIFPFIVVFQKNPLLCFEMVICLLQNYCQKWFEYHPLPPFNILGIIENILLEADPILLDFFYKRKITSTEYAWPLLQTTMSEVLPTNEWLILWDHLVSFQNPSFLLMIITAYNIYFRQFIMSSIHSLEDAKQFYCTKSAVRIKDLLEIAIQLDKSTPAHVHPRRYLRIKMISLPSNGPYPLFILREFPDFLIETSTVQSKQSEDRKNDLDSHYSQLARLQETERIHRQTEIFIQQIHKDRLNEAYKCLNAEVDIRKSCLSLPKENVTLSVSTNRQKLHNKFQQDVSELEIKVQSLLNSIKRKK